MARPISEAQRAAYQRNAEKSTGPPPAPGPLRQSRFPPQRHHPRTHPKIPLLSFEIRRRLRSPPRWFPPGLHLLRNYFRYSRDIQVNFHRTRQALAQAPKIDPAPL